MEIGGTSSRSKFVRFSSIILRSRGQLFAYLLREDSRMGRKLGGNIDTVAVMINWQPRERQGCDEHLDRVIQIRLTFFTNYKEKWKNKIKDIELQKGNKRSLVRHLIDQIFQLIKKKLNENYDYSHIDYSNFDSTNQRVIIILMICMIGFNVYLKSVPPHFLLRIN